jgi:hypothetical protein
MELPKIFYWSFGSVAVVLLLTASYLFYSNQVVASQYVKIEGVVVKNQFKNGMARPVIRYQWHSETKLFADNAYSKPPAYQRDEVVELFVNPNNPEEVVINTFFGRYFAMTIVGVMGLFFLGFLILFHFVFTKRL